MLSLFYTADVNAIIYLIWKLHWFPLCFFLWVSLLYKKYYQV